MIASLALASMSLAGCQGMIVNGIFIAKQQLTVRDSTEITVEATSFRVGSQMTYKAVAKRGRIVQASEFNKTFVYYAPYTSRFPDANGNPTTGDDVRIIVSDGFQTIETNQAIILSGGSMVFKGQSTGCTSDSSSDCNAPLYAATVDDSGLSVRDVRELKDSLGRKLTGSQPAVSPDGRKIVWVVWPGTDNSGLPKPTGSTAIYTMDAGGIVQQITGGSPDSGFNVDPSWSPQGNQIVFASDRGDKSNYDIWAVSTEQQNLAPVRLTSNAVDERYPAWNPNPQQRKYVAVAVHTSAIKDVGKRDTAAAWNVMLLNTQTGGYERQLTTLSQMGSWGPDFALEPRWRPDGQWLAYTYRGPVGGNLSNAQRYQRIFYQDINTSQGQILNPSEQGGAFVAESNPAWSPTGNEVAYLRYLADEKGNPNTEPQLYKGTPNLSKPGTTGPGTVGPQQWSLSQPVQAFHMLSTSAMPIGGWGFDWR
ncbi:MAG: PD40 domain-containing protein [Candidatus Sericytochromatia bacterium]|nr:PD40 domain-containing protein [Candidatus Tanganyikabacteria bacterium]